MKIHRRTLAVERATILTLATSLMACGGTTDPPAAGGASGGGEPAAGAPASGGRGTPVAGSTTGGSAGSPAAGGADGGGATLADQPLLPLVPEHASKFVFSPIDPGKPMTDTCPTPTASVGAEASVSLDGHTGKFYRTFCVDDLFLIEGQGDQLTAYETKNGQLQLPAIKG